MSPQAPARAGIVLVAALLCGPAAAAAQVVHGRVIDDGSGAPLELVDIELLDATGERRAQGASDTAGVFSIALPTAGEYRMRLSRLGYASVTTAPVRAAGAERVELELRMSAEAVPLEPLRVIGRAEYVPQRVQEFRDRAGRSRQTGRGRVFMRSDLERMRPPQPSALLAHVPPRGACRPTILLDGLPVSSPRELDTVVFVDALEGVEIYTGAAQMPPELVGRGYCAVAMYWTRHEASGGRPTLRRLLLAAGIIVGGFLLMN